MLHNLYILESFALIHPTKKVQNFLFLMIDHLLGHIGKNFIWVCSNTSISDLSFLLSFASTYFHHFSLNFFEKKLNFDAFYVRISIIGWHVVFSSFTGYLYFFFVVLYWWNKKVCREVHVVSMYEGPKYYQHSQELWFSAKWAFLSCSAKVCPF